MPKELDGLKIAHLSDLHVGLWTSPKEIPEIFAITQDLKPDLVVITGDMVDHNPSFCSSLVNYFYLLNKVPLGVFAIIGNHDIYTGADIISKSIESNGVNMLRDSNRIFTNHGLPMALVGIEDSGYNWAGSDGDANIDRAMGNLPKDLFPILLTHRPSEFEHAIRRNIPLTLCGHTHGGQFGMPHGPNLADLTYKFTHGLYNVANSTLHVSAGTGSVGLPFRIGVPAEIALIQLKA